MKKRYIKRVARALRLPRAQRREIIRDLEEIFASAREHGESDAATIERLGLPEAYALAVAEGFAPALDAKRPGKATIICFAAAAALAVLGAAALARRKPSNVIGWATGATTIQIAAPDSASVAALFAVAVAALLAAGIIQALKNHAHSGRREE